MKYRVVYTITTVKEIEVDADSVDEAQALWENDGYDGDLFFIEDESGNQVIYD